MDITLTLEDFRVNLEMNGHNSSDEDCKEVMKQFTEQYNSMFEGTDSAGNPTMAEFSNDEVFIDYTESDMFSGGDVETIIDDFFFEL